MSEIQGFIEVLLGKYKSNKKLILISVFGIIFVIILLFLIINNKTKTASDIKTSTSSAQKQATFSSSETKTEPKVKPIEAKVDDLTFKCQQLVIVNPYTNFVSIVSGPENYCEIYRNNSLIIHTKYIYNVEYFGLKNGQNNYKYWNHINFDYNKEAGLVAYQTDSRFEDKELDYTLLDIKTGKETILQSINQGGRGGIWWDQSSIQISPNVSFVMMVNTVSEVTDGETVANPTTLVITDTNGKKLYSLGGAQAFWYSDNTFYYMELSAQYPVYRVDISTKASTKILNNWTRPVLSPDKTKIAFARDESGEGGQVRSDVLIYYLDSKTETILVKDATGPKWVDSNILSVNTLRKCTPKDNCLHVDLNYTVLSEGSQYNLSGQLVKEGTAK